MKTKKVLSLIVLSLTLITLTSCTTLKSVFGRSAKQETNQAGKINNVDKALGQNDKAKLDQVSVLASGTDYALNKVTNKEPTVTVAQDINKRVISLSGKPNLDAEKEMWKTVDQLTSDLEKEKSKGVKALQKKDQQIADIQTESRELQIIKDEEIAKYMKQAAETARIADSRKAELDDYKGWMGLKAVGKGLWQFITSSMWILGIGGIVFLILRLAATTNPICAAVFSIFEQMIAWVINTIKIIFPKALSYAGHVTQEVSNGWKNTLSKLVDQLQFLKQKDPNAKFTIDELCSTFKLDGRDTDRIDSIKRELKWK